MKRKASLFFNTLVLFGVTLAGSSCSLLDNIMNQVGDAMGIRLSESKKTCVPGQKFKLKVFEEIIKGEVEEYTNYDANSWSSTNEEVATVDDRGNVVCHKVGSCDINFKSVGTKSCHVKVIEKELKSIKISRLKKKYAIGITQNELKGQIRNNSTITAVYTNNYEEAVIPQIINVSEVDTNTYGTYPVTFSYYITSNDLKESATGNIEITDASETSDKEKMERSIFDYADSSIRTTGYLINGKFKSVVIPIWFTDSDNFISEAKKDNIRNDAQKVFFSDNPSEDIGWESAKTYYEKESRVNGLLSGEKGLVDIDGKVSDWFIDTNPSSVYKDSEPESDLKQRAVDWYFSTTGENINDYDANNDGYLDGVIFMYGAPDYSTTGDSTNNLWYHVIAHSFSSRPSISTPILGNNMWVSYASMYGENNFKDRVGKNDYVKHYGKNTGLKLNPHTYIHETGHMFCLQDYYSTTRDESLPTENTMQSNNIGGHDPYSLLINNWANAYIPNESMTLDIRDVQSSHDIVLLTPKWNDAYSPFDEYIALELFAPNGLNEFDSNNGYGFGAYSEVGLRIWHIDSRLYCYDTGEITTDPRDGRTAILTDNSRGSPSGSQQIFKDHDEYPLLHLLRNDKDFSIDDTRLDMQESHYFKAGSTFSLEEFDKQFVEEGKLNNGLKLNWSVTVKNIYTNLDGSYGATLELIKSE